MEFSSFENFSCNTCMHFTQIILFPAILFSILLFIFIHFFVLLFMASYTLWNGTEVVLFRSAKYNLPYLLLVLWSFNF